MVCNLVIPNNFSPCVLGGSERTWEIAGCQYSQIEKMNLCWAAWGDNRLKKAQLGQKISFQVKSSSCGSLNEALENLTMTLSRLTIDSSISDCMCNGHSKCSMDGKTCDKPCNHHTEGDHCDRCSKGYFGFPVNGGECESKLVLIDYKILYFTLFQAVFSI